MRLQTRMSWKSWSLGPRATLKLLSDADHSFHVPARSGRKDEEVRAELLDTLAAWIETMV